MRLNSAPRAGSCGRSGVPDSARDGLLARIYEAFNGEAADTRFYLRLAEAEAARAATAPLSVLDAGCGTGLLATRLAKAGHAVTAADMSAAMLAFARRRCGGHRVDFVEADLRQLDLRRSFDLVVMTGHVVQAFLTDEDLTAVLGILKGHLKPGGRLAFETRNPRMRAFERWRPSHSRRCQLVPGIGAVEAVHALTSLSAGGTVAFRTHYRLLRSGRRMTTDSRLRFFSAETITDILGAVGFSDIRLYGDFTGAPLGPKSPEIVVVAGQGRP